MARLLKPGGEYLLVLQGICIHNKSHNLHLILGLNCVYIFTGVGITMTMSSSPAMQYNRRPQTPVRTANCNTNAIFFRRFLLKMQK